MLQQQFFSAGSGDSYMKSLIVYYSYSGITRRLAEDIALITDAELLELKPQEPYSFSYNTAVKEVRAQIEKGVCPALMQYDIDVADFDTIFIGSPNWLKTFAPPVLSFLRSTDLSGKTIIPFCTHGGGGFGNMIEEYQRECGASRVMPGLAAKGTYTLSEVQKWLESIGLSDASTSS